MEEELLAMEELKKEVKESKIKCLKNDEEEVKETTGLVTTIEKKGTVVLLVDAHLTLSFEDCSQISQQKSRLNQWKLPALDKKEGGDCSRAPGLISISKHLAPTNNSTNLNPLRQPDDFIF
ncbi:hypothetical protein FQA39_LY08970 [Lamprigera yunnana]|nr:hypothetical protein FQA39_LY08970 [Lamprigera yunnana]